MQRLALRTLRRVATAAILPGLLAISSCAITRTPGPAWWGEMTDSAGQTRHVINGGIATELYKAAPRVRISIPANWRAASRERQDGELVAVLDDVIIEQVNGEPVEFSPTAGPIVVQREAELRGKRPAGAKSVPQGGTDTYLIRERQGTEQLGVDVIGFDGWPPTPVRLARYDWAITADEARGWQENPFLRGPLQLIMFATGVGLIIWIAEGGLEDTSELDW